MAPYFVTLAGFTVTDYACTNIWKYHYVTQGRQIRRGRDDLREHSLAGKEDQRQEEEVACSVAH